MFSVNCGSVLLIVTEHKLRAISIDIAGIITKVKEKEVAIFGVRHPSHSKKSANSSSRWTWSITATGDMKSSPAIQVFKIRSNFFCRSQ